MVGQLEVATPVCRGAGEAAFVWPNGPLSKSSGEIAAMLTAIRVRFIKRFIEGSGIS
jgi:hypothetical protein